MGLFFWPFMIASVIISIIAIAGKKPRILYICAVLLLPISLYLAATPRFHVWGLIFPIFYIGAAICLTKNKRAMSVLLVIPNYLLIGWLGLTVLTQ
jgi:hypothetical protein